MEIIAPLLEDLVKLYSGNNIAITILNLIIAELPLIKEQVNKHDKNISLKSLESINDKISSLNSVTIQLNTDQTLTDRNILISKILTEINGTEISVKMKK